mmetsp:Transcript_52902/g.123629  ORF Transcript_52902/g.123629 Transcript_52902/m.123629 type:complete len:276 (+) Transcript_52902:604-1431(+)
MVKLRLGGSASGGATAEEWIQVGCRSNGWESAGRKRSDDVAGTTIIPAAADDVDLLCGIMSLASEKTSNEPVKHHLLEEQNEDVAEKNAQRNDGVGITILRKRDRMAFEIQDASLDLKLLLCFWEDVREASRDEDPATERVGIAHEFVNGESRGSEDKRKKTTDDATSKNEEQVSDFLVPKIGRILVVVSVASMQIAAWRMVGVDNLVAHECLGTKLDYRSYVELFVVIVMIMLVVVTVIVVPVLMIMSVTPAVVVVVVMVVVVMVTSTVTVVKR